MSLLYKSKYKNYRDEDIVEFNEINLNNDYGFEVNKINNLNFYNKEMKNTWLFEYYEKSDYSEESITAFYFPNNFTRKKLKTKLCTVCLAMQIA